ncbi:hypothetical protein [Cupriavidus lacunae]|uniref:Uncharacterized protein n=1 Tax=Cupriavidus lacunae TaxID=2666307 RepID=A0A370NYJ6_9BURK|nr:hypothetical protein [Cupriavidus lacunae]RDK10654.1 hypothetical protein DN412_08465 [Cupriavidus lacunae]
MALNCSSVSGFRAGQVALKDAIDKRDKEIARLNKQVVAKDQDVIVAKQQDRERQREATNSALIEIKTEMVAMKKTIERMEGDRYTGADARRDFAWRDERVAEQGKRLTDPESEVRGRRR